MSLFCSIDEWPPTRSLKCQKWRTSRTSNPSEFYYFNTNSNLKTLIVNNYKKWHFVLLHYLLCVMMMRVVAVGSFILFVCVSRTKICIVHSVNCRKAKRVSWQRAMSAVSAVNWVLRNPCRSLNDLRYARSTCTSGPTAPAATWLNVIRSLSSRALVNFIDCLFVLLLLLLPLMTHKRPRAAWWKWTFFSCDVK